MASEEYINPIIQAMVASRESADRQNQQKLEAQRIKQEGQHQQAMHEELMRRLEQELEIQTRTLNEVHIPQVQAALAQHKIEQAKGIAELTQAGLGPQLIARASGGQYNPGGPGAPGLPQGVESPQGAPAEQPSITIGTQGKDAEAIPLSAFGRTPEQSIDLEARRAGALESAKQGAIFPWQQRTADNAMARNMTLKELESNLEKDRDRLKNEFTGTQNELNRQNQRGIAGMEVGTRLRIANQEDATKKLLSGFSDDPEGDNNLVSLKRQQFENGEAKPNPGKIVDSLAINQINGLGHSVVDPDTIKGLKNQNGLNQVLGKMQEFISTKLPETQTGALLQGIGVHTAWPTDLKNEWDTLKSQALTVGKGLESQTGGRFNVKQLELDLDSLPGVGQDRLQAQKKLNALADQMKNIKHNILLTGVPPEQKKGLDSKYGLTEPTTANGGKYVTYDKGQNWYDAKTGAKVQVQ